MPQTSIFCLSRNFPIDRFVGLKFWQSILQTLCISQVVCSLHLMLYLGCLHYMLQRNTKHCLRQCTWLRKIVLIKSLFILST